MSIVTKGGDLGMTGLMYNRRVSKCHPRVETYGAVDELNSALGMAKAVAKSGDFREFLTSTQKDLVTLMGELATASEDLERYVRDGFPRITSDCTARLDSAIRDLEASQITFTGWATPGENPFSAALDFARTVCRRAERSVVALKEASEMKNDEIIIFLNRLSDLLWLMARKASTES